MPPPTPDDTNPTNNVVPDNLDDVSQGTTLTGFLNDTLGDICFYLAIVNVIVFYFSYIFYDAFFATRESSIIKSDCYCDPTDRKFYRIAMVVSIIIWIILLFVYVIICIYTQLQAEDKLNDCDRGIENQVKNIEEESQVYLRELVMTKILGEYHNSTQANTAEGSKHVNRQEFNTNMDQDAAVVENGTTAHHSTSSVVEITPHTRHVESDNDTTAHNGNDVENDATTPHICDDAVVDTQNDTTAHQDVVVENNKTTHHNSVVEKDATRHDKINAEGGQKKPKTQCCLMCFNFFLVVLRFCIRSLIVPLLQLQLLNDYSWNCLLNNMIRNYCKTENTKHYVSLDHSLVTYLLYILLLIAMLLTFLIEWLPKGASCTCGNSKGRLNTDSL